jgi:hypothetical protein
MATMSDYFRGNCLVRTSSNRLLRPPWLFPSLEARFSLFEHLPHQRSNVAALNDALLLRANAALVSDPAALASVSQAKPLAPPPHTLSWLRASMSARLQSAIADADPNPPQPKPPPCPIDADCACCKRCPVASCARKFTTALGLAIHKRVHKPPEPAEPEDEEQDGTDAAAAAASEERQQAQLLADRDVSDAAAVDAAADAKQEEQARAASMQISEHSGRVRKADDEDADYIAEQPVRRRRKADSEPVKPHGAASESAAPAASAATLPGRPRRQAAQRVAAATLAAQSSSEDTSELGFN